MFWAFDFGLGISLLDGVYLATNEDPDDAEIKVGVSAFLMEILRIPTSSQNLLPMVRCCSLIWMPPMHYSREMTMAMAL